MNNYDIPIEDRILALIERINRVYEHLLRRVATENRISTLHLKILLYLYLNRNRKERLTISNISNELLLTKSTVSEAVSTLISKNLVKSQTHDIDRRIRILELSPNGYEIVNRILDWDEPIKSAIKLLGNRKNGLLINLMEIAKYLIDRGLMREFNMCMTCRFFIKEANLMKCRVLGIVLEEGDLRVDCPDYVIRVEARA